MKRGRRASHPWPEQAEQPDTVHVYTFDRKPATVVSSAKQWAQRNGWRVEYRLLGSTMLVRWRRNVG